VTKLTSDECLCSSKIVKAAFNNKSPDFPFQAVCVKSVTRGNIVSDIWNLQCNNFDERNDLKVQKWPFNAARNGNSEIKITMQRKKGRSAERNCKKVLHKKYRNQKGVIKCEPEQSKPSCRCQQYTDRIAKEANLADKDVHPLTASCSGENSNRDGMETWNVHCDSNQNGKIDPGEISDKINVITKSKNFCKIKKTLNRGISCQKKAKAKSCYCAESADYFKRNFQNEFSRHHRKGKSIELKCEAGTEANDEWTIEIFKHGISCQKPVEFNFKHNRDQNICSRKFLSELNSLLKTTRC